MKICLIGESTKKLTGFGQQTKLLATELARQGMLVDVIGMGEAPSQETLPFRQWFSRYDDVDEIDRIITKIKPGVVIDFFAAELLKVHIKTKVIPSNCPMYLWLLWEGVSLPPFADKYFPFFDSKKIVHVTNYGQRLWKGIADGPIIPHGIDSDIFKPIHSTEKDKVKQRWINKLELNKNAFLILNVDRNDRRKNWDLVFSYIASVKAATHRPVQLIAHCKKVQDINGYNLPELAKLYGVEKNVVYTEYDWTKGLTTSDLAELYGIVDIRLSCSGGEGFGLPTVESLACGTKNIVPSNTAFNELYPEGRISDIANIYRDGVLWGVPDIKGMRDVTINAMDNGQKDKIHVSDRVRTDFDIKKVATKWIELVKEHGGELYPTNRYGFLRKAELYAEWNILLKLVEDMRDNRNVVLFGANDVVVEGLKLQGTPLDIIEHDAKLIKSLPNYTREFVSLEEPKAHVAVILDYLERCPALDHLLITCHNYNWVIVKETPSYKWDIPPVDMKDFGIKLEKCGMYRRHDLENLARNKYETANIGCQIWQNSDRSDMIPNGLTK